MVSLNVQRQLGIQASFDALLGEIGDAYPHWAGACFMESDAHFNAEFSLGDSSKHTVRRHWPGSGSVAMTLVIRDKWARFVREVKFEGRTCMVHWRLSRAQQLHTIFWHGAHNEDFVQSLSDMTFIAKRCKNSSNVVLLGDFNVDLLPNTIGDPYAGLPHRAEKHLEERLMLQQALDACRFDFIPFESVSGCTPTAVHPECAAVPITRIPLGDQHGTPACLDHVVARGAGVKASLWWSAIPTDHAAAVAEIDIQKQQRARFARSTWRCADARRAEEWARDNAPASFDDPIAMSLFVCKMQGLHADTNTCAQRRRHREPAAVKTLRQRAKAATSPQQRQHYLKLAFEGKRHWLKTLAEIRAIANFEKSRPAWKSKKLRPLKQMLDSTGETTLDHERWRDLVQAEFRGIWKCGNPAKRSVINDRLAQWQHQGITVSAIDVDESFRDMKHHRVLDNFGICFHGLKLLFDACPQQVADMLNRLATNQSFMEMLTLRGRVKAKKPGAIPASKIRTILPMPCILSLLDSVVAKRVHQLADSFAQRVPFGFLECAKKHRQCLDAVFPSSIIIERSLDNMSQATISQQDVKQYYDYLQPLKIADWIHSVMHDVELAATLLRIHVCPLIILQVASFEAVFKHRTVGMCTGSRSAGAAGRLPLLEAADSRMPVWETKCFHQCGRPFALATFVDNLIVPALTPQDAIYVQNDIAAHLLSRWGLLIGRDSKELLVCKGWRGIAGDTSGWQQCASMKTLGHWLSNDGGYRKCCQETMAAMVRSFYGNIDTGIRKAGKRVKQRFLAACVLPIAQARWARWPFLTTTASKLDGLQRKMLASLFNVSPSSSEPYEDFCQRRHAETAALAREMGLWSRQWAKSIVNWADHVDREHDPFTWSKDALEWRDSFWLQMQRFLHSGSSGSRTRTRCSRGTPAKRWQDGVTDARGLVARTR